MAKGKEWNAATEVHPYGKGPWKRVLDNARETKAGVSPGSAPPIRAAEVLIVAGSPHRDRVVTSRPSGWPPCRPSTWPTGKSSPTTVRGGPRGGKELPGNGRLALPARPGPQAFRYGSAVLAEVTKEDAGSREMEDLLWMVFMHPEFQIIREVRRGFQMHLLGLAAPIAPAGGRGVRWYKGNTHTHTLWSVGNDFPETAADWYKKNGYHFLVLSDHNVLQRGERWKDVTKHERENQVVSKHLKRWGEGKLALRKEGSKTLAKLMTLEEIRRDFEEEGKFIMIEGFELTTAAGRIEKKREFGAQQRGQRDSSSSHRPRARWRNCSDTRPTWWRPMRASRGIGFSGTSIIPTSIMP